ncbi:MAG: sodium:proton exchanger, partial [Candidatus Dadabacteria bacterium]
LAARWAPHAEVSLIEDSQSRGELPRAGHVVIVGYGLNGRNLARVLAETSIPYCVIEFDGVAAADARREGHPVLYGDATRTHVLERAHVGDAIVVVVAIRDAAATRAIVRAARRMNKTAAIVVRTHYVAEIESLYALGADDVIPEEFETSVEIFSRVLQRLDIPPNVIAAQIDVLRAEHYALLRGAARTRRYAESIYDIFMAATTVTYLVREGSPAIGRTLDEIGLRRATGANVIALVRGGQAITNPPLSTVIERGDILVLLGNHSQIAAARAALDPVEPPPPS